MSIYVHVRCKLYEVDGEKIKCWCSEVVYHQGKTLAKLISLGANGGTFWYDPILKIRTHAPAKINKQ